MHTQVLDDSRPVVMVMKRLGLGSVCSGVECDALSLVCALAGSETTSSALPLIGTSQTAPISKDNVPPALCYLDGLDTACVRAYMCVCVCVVCMVCDIIKMAPWRPQPLLMPSLHLSNFVEIFNLL